MYVVSTYFFQSNFGGMAIMHDYHLSTEQIKKVSLFFKAISDPTRLKILLVLSRSEESVGKIAEKIEMEQSAVSHQLRLLRTNRLVKSRKSGKEVFYSLDDEHVVDILDQTIRHVAHH